MQKMYNYKKNSEFETNLETSYIFNILIFVKLNDFNFYLFFIFILLMLYKKTG